MSQNSELAPDEPAPGMPFGKRAFLFVMHSLPAVVVAVAFWNWLYERLGSDLKDLFFLLSVIYFVYHYTMLALGATRLRHGRLYKFRKVIATVLVVGAMPFVVFALRASYALTTLEGDFQLRVSNVLEHRYRLSDNPWSPMCPDGVYRWAKRTVGRPFYPQLKDEGRQYDLIRVYACHFGVRGVIGYEYAGSAMSDDSTEFFFVNYGEADTLRPPIEPVIFTLPDSQQMKHRYFTPLPRYQGAAVLTSVYLPADFHFARFFVAESSMTRDYEGFPLDFRAVKHPPKTIEVIFLTDREIYHEDVHALRRNWDLRDPFLTRPLYPIDDRNRILSIHPVCDEAWSDSVLASFDFLHLPVDTAKYRAYRFECPVEEDCCFLLHYKIEESTLYR